MTQSKGLSRVQAPDRFQVRCGMAEGEPFIELNDNLAMQQITLDLDSALIMAGSINQLIMSMMQTMREHAQHQRNGIVTVNGSPI